MKKITPYTIASKYIGIKEIPGILNNQIIMAMLRLDNQWPENDEVPWCSAFVNWIAFNAGVKRTKSLLARSWLAFVPQIPIDCAEQGYDIVILSRGDNPPGPNNLTAPGHVGFYAFHHGKSVWVLGGNQGDSVSISEYPIQRMLGIRRLS